MRALFLTLLLTSCVTSKVQPVEDSKAIKIAKLEQSITRLSYLIDDNMCHIQYGVCLGEKRKTDKECRDTKQQCIINVYNLWKKLLE